MILPLCGLDNFERGNFTLDDAAENAGRHKAKRRRKTGSKKLVNEVGQQGKAGDKTISKYFEHSFMYM